MFSSLAHLIPPPGTGRGPAEKAPPPTPVQLPKCQPRRRAATTGRIGSDVSAESFSPRELTTVLQDLVRPADQITLEHLELLGVHVIADVSLEQLIPDPSCLPDFDKWDALSREDALALNYTPQPELCNGKTSPGPSKYVDIRLGLLNNNGKAFRSVNRVSPRPGDHVVRLGYCHEFFRDLEQFTIFWDDTSVSWSINSQIENASGGDNIPSTETFDGAVEAAPEAMDICAQATAEDLTTKDSKPTNNPHECYRTSAGEAMPPNLRTKLLTSFLKLITYDFSCNIAARQGPEPRLHITTPAGVEPRKSSFFSSGCNFISRTPLDREAAKRGVGEGPIAAVSPRHTTLFPPRGRERESVIDMSREVLCGLITAQNRAREGCVEVRIGKDAWWATKRRWGGGPGGPVGKEEEMEELWNAMPHILKRDETPASTTKTDKSPTGASLTGGAPLNTPYNSPMGGAPLTEPSASSSTTTAGAPAPATGPAPCRSRSRNGSFYVPTDASAKRARTQLAAYDNYRMIRPPSLHWDPRARYMAIGRAPGATGYDDVFVISCLFHHISVLRMRVPDLLLAVLRGDVADPGLEARGSVEVFRSRWFDFFLAEDRAEAMKVVWAVMAYSMRKIEPEEEDEKKDGDEKEASDGAKQDSPGR